MPAYQQTTNINGYTTFTANSARRLQAESERLGWSFIADSTSPITGIDFRTIVAGTITDQNFRMEIQTDDAGKPSGTVLGAATAEFAGPSSNNSWMGIRNLAENTGNLVVNARYWIVLYWSSGTSPNSSNYIGFADATSFPVGREIHRKFNGTDWTTVSSVNRSVNSVIKREDDTLYGIAINSSSVGGESIFGSNRSGYKFRCGAPIIVNGFRFSINKSGTPPGDLEILLYEEDIQKDIVVLPSSEISTSVTSLAIWFPSKAVLLPNRDLFVVFRQASDAGSSVNRYRLFGNTIESQYREVEISPVDCGAVEGTGNDPTQLTLVNNFDLQCGFMIQSLEDSIVLPTPAEIADAVWSHEPRELTS